MIDHIQCSFLFYREQGIISAFKEWQGDKVASQIIVSGVKELRKILDKYVSETFMVRKQKEHGPLRGRVKWNLDGFIDDKPYAIEIIDGYSLHEVLVTFVHEISELALSLDIRFKEIRGPKGKRDYLLDLSIEEEIDRLSELLVEKYYDEVLDLFKEKCEHQQGTYVFASTPSSYLPPDAY